MHRIPLAIFLFLSALFCQYELRELSALDETVHIDLHNILKEAHLPLHTIDFIRFQSDSNFAKINCLGENILIEIHAEDSEWSSVFYLALQKLGFLFPHPRIQISPETIDIEGYCGEIYYWKPALKYRGFHFHTQHPNEWVHGFMLSKKQIAMETIRWLARNQQNIFDFHLLRGVNKKQLYKDLQKPFQYAKEMGIHAGVSFGVASQQQNNWKLVSILGTFFDSMSRRQIQKHLTELLESIDLSFISVEAGTSEFTSVNYERSLDWLNQISEIAESYKVQMMTKVHVSSNQNHEKYGNYNFLPQYANSNVGVLPHTVFAYGFEDKSAPMYGNDNFSHIKDFMIQQNGKRMNWYNPETSYYISMDIDIPLLHLEYLRVRSQDMQFLYTNGIEGQLNFTTGQELGYWIIDWTVALLANSDYNFDPLIALKMINENPDIWKEHLDFHNTYMHHKQLVQIVTFSNGGDELFPSHKIHKRNLLKELSKSEERTQFEIDKLEDAIKSIPSTDGIVNHELKNLLDITYFRFHHALYTRKALMGQKDENLEKAKTYRLQAQELMDVIIENNNRYPEAMIFEIHKNPTAYQYGYGETASRLHYWLREEEMIRRNKYHPFFMNTYNYFDIVF